MHKDIKEILAPIHDQLQSVDKAIRQKLSTGMADVDESAQYLFESGGKRVRASLVILASGLKGGSVDDEVIHLAAAAEILHAATLIHDDIIDQSFLRRGVITVPRKWGNKLAVLVGDYMWNVALTIALSDMNPEIFPLMVSGTRDMIRGELFQLQYSNVASITRDHYMQIIELKTAKFMSACTKLGAIKAGFGDAEIAIIEEYGMNLGFAFQMIDDALDIKEGDGGKTGKDFGNDFKDGKITLPILYLLENAEQRVRNEVIAFSSNPDDEGWDAIKRHLADMHALEYTIECARPYVEKAISLVGSFPDTPYKKILVELAEFFLYRDF